MTIRSIRQAWLFILVAAGVGCASHRQGFAPVREGPQSNLGVTVQPPGTDHWFVNDQRQGGKWRVLYKYENPAEPARTRFIVLQVERFAPGGFVPAHTSLRQLADKILQESRQESPEGRFKEKWAEVVRSDRDGAEAYRVRIAWEERNNRTLPGLELLMQNIQILFLHPRNPDEVVSILVSTRHAQGKDPLDPEDLIKSFVGSIRFE